MDFTQETMYAGSLTIPHFMVEHLLSDEHGRETSHLVPIFAEISQWHALVEDKTRKELTMLQEPHRETSFAEPGSHEKATSSVSSVSQVAQRSFLDPSSRKTTSF